MPCRRNLAEVDAKPTAQQYAAIGVAGVDTPAELRLLGDVIREQEGPAAFELVEKIRKLSVAFRRDADHEADKALKDFEKALAAPPPLNPKAGES